jgi:AbrB family looped-hinge helix DNA binding protein
MPSYRTKLTRNGRITIPAAIRRALNLAAGDRLTVEQVGDAIRIRRATVTELTAGSLAKYRKVPPLTLEEERAAFEQGVADEVMASLASECDD